MVTPLFALMGPNFTRLDLVIAIEVAFWIFVPLCFVAVATYAVTQIQQGRLLINENSPLPLKPNPLIACLFIVGIFEMIFVQSPLYMMLVPIAMAGFLLETRRTADEQFGLRRLSTLQLLAWGLMICGAIILVEVPLMDATARLLSALHVPHPEQPAVERFRQLSDTSDILWVLIQAAVLAPLIEELFFRGFLLTFLRNYTSTWMALVLSAGVFAFAHSNLGSAIPLWFLGIVLGIAYQNSGSLLLPMYIHGCFNLITAFNLLLMKAAPGGP